MFIAELNGSGCQQYKGEHVSTSGNGIKLFSLLFPYFIYLEVTWRCGVLFVPTLKAAYANVSQPLQIRWHVPSPQHSIGSFTHWTVQNVDFDQSEHMAQVDEAADAQQRLQCFKYPVILSGRRNFTLNDSTDWSHFKCLSGLFASTLKVAGLIPAPNCGEKAIQLDPFQCNRSS